jgi:hypothetical protein
MMDNPCSGRRRDGTPCSKGAMGKEARKKHLVPDEAPPLCYWCWRGNDSMVRAGNTSHRTRKKPVSSVADVYGYEIVLEVLAPALVAVVEEPGFPRVPDWTARLAACALLIECQSDWMRDSPEKVRELLDRFLPERVAHERFTPDAVYKALAAEKQVLRDRGHPLAQFLAD